MANINGWGRGTWDQGEWSTVLPVEVTGQAITSAIGSVTVYENEIVTLTGNAITLSLGSVSTIAKANIVLTGIAINTSVGVPLVWGELNPDQTPSYATIDESQTPSYATIDESQTPAYEEINAGRDAA
jgi:hypothetical protein